MPHFFYFKVKDGISASARAIPTGFPWPQQDLPVAFIHAEGYETSEGSSKSNQVEAQIVMKVCADLLSGGLTPEQIGVVTPYSGQVRILRRHLRNGASDPRMKVEVSSVDGFQGREKEVIIFSAVRANAHGQLGFLADWRRVNVAFTRPKCGLVVIGHRPTLESEPETWSRWLQWASAKGIIVNDPRPRMEYNSASTRAINANNPLLQSQADQNAHTEHHQYNPCDYGQVNVNHMVVGLQMQLPYGMQQMQPKQQTLPQGWVQYATPEGKPYYHHAASNRTEWEMPSPFSVLAQIVPPAMPASDSTAMQQIDEACAILHSSTGVTAQGAALLAALEQAKPKAVANVDPYNTAYTLQVESMIPQGMAPPIGAHSMPLRPVDLTAPTPYVTALDHMNPAPQDSSYKIDDKRGWEQYGSNVDCSVVRRGDRRDVDRGEQRDERRDEQRRSSRREAEKRDDCRRERSRSPGGRVTRHRSRSRSRSRSRDRRRSDRQKKYILSRILFVLFVSFLIIFRGFLKIDTTFRKLKKEKNSEKKKARKEKKEKKSCRVVKSVTLTLLRLLDAYRIRASSCNISIFDRGNRQSSE